MQIDFQIDGFPVRYARDWFMGGETVLVNGQPMVLQSASDLSTHFNLKLTSASQVIIGNHAVVFERTRSLWFGGVRPMTYRIFVDGQMIIERVGY